MSEQPNYDSRTWVDEPGVSTGDRRENDPRAAGFTAEDDRVFRSHFQHANHLADRSYEHVRPAYELGLAAGRQQGNESRGFDEIETDLEQGWLNVRVAGGEWAAVRDFVRAGFDRARQGRVADMPPAGTTPSHDRVSYSDPVAGNIDPTAPDAPTEQSSS
jgi:hypothetical protein